MKEHRYSSYTMLLLDFEMSSINILDKTMKILPLNYHCQITIIYCTIINYKDKAQTVSSIYLYPDYHYYILLLHYIYTLREE
jgi:hypothetical protein